MQKLLFARGRDEFAFKVIDRAMAPKHRLRPRRTLIVLFCAMLGGAAAAFFTLVRPVVRQGRKVG
jgi:LPS O-antigen subunit length determinant protein (WzzB/FepE family)